MVRSFLGRAWEPLVVLLITLLAAALRLYRLDQLPPGLHYDEAFNAVNARAALSGGGLKLFFASNMGQEPMIIWLVGAAFALLGQAAWVTRLPSAVIGTLTVPLVWWLGRELPWLRNGQAPSRTEPVLRSESTFLGLGAALVLTVLYWHLSFSRIGMEPILVPFFAVLALASLAHALNMGPWLAYGLAGVALGGSLYTYKAGYLVPLLAAVLVAYTVIVRHAVGRRVGRGLLLTLGAFLVVAAPLAVYFVGHPADFVHRPASVVLSSGLLGEGQGQEEGLLSSLGRVLGMFFVRGDSNPRSNLPGRPALDPFLAFLFIIALGRALVETVRRRPGAATLSLIWLVLMTVPTLITEYPPHFARAIGATPALALLCATGGWMLWETARRRPIARSAMALILVAGMGFSAWAGAQAYFVTWGRSPDLFYAYDVGLVDLADYFNTLPQEEAAYLTPTAREHYTLQFLLRRSIGSFDGREGSVLPPLDQPASVAVLLQEDQVTLPALQQARPDGRVVWQLLDDWGRPYAAVYHMPACGSQTIEECGPTPEHAVEASFGGVAQLLGYSVAPSPAAPGNEVTLTLYWRALAPSTEDYTVFTHLLGPYNPATNGAVWVGHDGQPDGGHHPTSAWQRGEIIQDVHRWTLPADIPAGEYGIEVGLYLLSTMERLPAAAADGRPLADNAAQLGPLEVAGTAR